MTISDSELNSYSEGAGWNKGWSEGSSQGTSKNESKQGGASVNVKVMGSGGDSILSDNDKVYGHEILKGNTK